MVESQLIIENRYNGPPDSGNGGYTCGLLANFIEGPAEVTLRHPPPINTPMTVKKEKHRLALYNEDVLIAEAKQGELDLIPPNPPTFDAASISTVKEDDIKDHYFPKCFVCGPKRRLGDGLRIFPGPVEGENYFASVWIPDSSLSDKTGYIKNEIIWAALDCPGAWTIVHEKARFIVLGRLVGEILGKIRCDEKCIVIGWKLSDEGRKVYTGTAVYSSNGQLYAKGRATWIEIQ
jgi:hypothetical protein